MYLSSMDQSASITSHTDLCLWRKAVALWLCHFYNVQKSCETWNPLLSDWSWLFYKTMPSDLAWPSLWFTRTLPKPGHSDSSLSHCFGNVLVSALLLSLSWKNPRVSSANFWIQVGTYVAVIYSVPKFFCLPTIKWFIGIRIIDRAFHRVVGVQFLAECIFLEDVSGGCVRVVLALMRARDLFLLATPRFVHALMVQESLWIVCSFCK